MEYRLLGQTGVEVSSLAFGCASLTNIYPDFTSQEENIRTVRAALDAGINYFDTAPWYGQGQSEATLGEALERIPRESFIIATKVGRYEKDVHKMFDFSAEKTRVSVDKSLTLLRTDYIDIVQIHDVEFAPDVNVILNQTLPALRDLQRQGKIRYIGITGYNINTLKHIVEKSHVKIDTVLSYARYTMYDTCLADYLEYFNSRGVGVINASPLGMGLLTQLGPASWHPGTSDLKEVCAEAVSYSQEQDMDISRLALHFSLQNREFATTIVGMGRMDVLESNLNLVQNGITQDEEQVLNYILSRYFKDHPTTHWENLELRKYIEKLNRYLANC